MAKENTDKYGVIMTVNKTTCGQCKYVYGSASDEPCLNHCPNNLKLNQYYKPE